MDALETGLRIAELYQRWRECDTSNMSECVTRGLMTLQEVADYRAGLELEGRAYVAKRQAEDAIPRPPIIRPAKYQAALDRLRTLEDQRSRLREAGGAFNACYSHYHSSQEFAAHFQSPGLQLGIKEIIRTLPQERELDREIESANRSYNAFRRIHGEAEDAAYNAFRRVQEQAGRSAYDAVMSEGQSVTLAARAATMAMKRRVRELRDPIIAEIRSLLDTTSAISHAEPALKEA